VRSGTSKFYMGTVLSVFLTLGFSLYLQKEKAGWEVKEKPMFVLWTIGVLEALIK
jgi:hypothetical protein